MSQSILNADTYQENDDSIFSWLANSSKLYWDTEKWVFIFYLFVIRMLFLNVTCTDEGKIRKHDCR